MKSIIPKAPDSRLQAPGRKFNQEPSSSLLRVPLPTCWQCPQGSPASSLRAAFTLTELLVVISIIGMLAGLSMGALYSARETARVSKTKATISKLDSVIQAKYAEFESRRLPILTSALPTRDPNVMAELKLQVLREIIRMEMPDRLTDLTYPKISGSTTGDIGNLNATFYVGPQLVKRTAANRKIYRRVAGNTAFWTGPDPNYGSAECLYLIVNSDPEARELFRDDEIGDVDGDGVNEFIDAWGMPIKFLRWAPGLRTEIQHGPNPDDPTSTPDADNDHDPFDPMRVDTIAFRLVPYIYSAGPDKEYGIVHEDEDDPWVFQYGGMSVDGDKVGRLYEHAAATVIGTPKLNDSGNRTDYDNITNHELGMN